MAKISTTLVKLPNLRGFIVYRLNFFCPLNFTFFVYMAILGSVYEKSLFIKFDTKRIRFRKMFQNFVDLSSILTVENFCKSHGRPIDGKKNVFFFASLLLLFFYTFFVFVFLRTAIAIMKKTRFGFKYTILCSLDWYIENVFL